MVQVAPRSGGAPANPPESLDQINALIAEKDQELKQAQKNADRALKQMQQELAELTARKTARTAFEQENSTGDKALQTALEKGATAGEKADELNGEAEKLAGMLSDQQVEGIPTIVAEFDATHTRLRDGLNTAIAEVVKRAKEELTAKADSARAKADTAEAKRKLTARTQAIDQVSGRITALVTEAKTAIAQGQIPTAYLLLVDLEYARAALDTLTDKVEIEALRQTVATAWSQERDVGVTERAATWALTQAKDAQQTAQNELAAFEAGRRAELKKALDALGSDGGGGEGGKPRPGGQETGRPAPTQPEIVGQSDDGLSQADGDVQF